jgi:hypothetical protein
MFRLDRKLRETVEINAQLYQLDLSFDNVIRFLELLNDESLDGATRIFVGLEVILKQDPTSISKDFEELTTIFELLVHEFLFETHKQAVVFDIKGNPVKKKVAKKADKTPDYSLIHDASYIYAAFMQTYGIDLIEVQGKLHWEKFKALLNGLPSDTKFAEVIQIRNWEPQKGDTAKRKEEMRKLQNQYKLPE